MSAQQRSNKQRPRGNRRSGRAQSRNNDTIIVSTEQVIKRDNNRLTIAVTKNDIPKPDTISTRLKVKVNFSCENMMSWKWGTAPSASGRDFKSAAWIPFDSFETITFSIFPEKDEDDNVAAYWTTLSFQIMGYKVEGLA
uniref:Uncharacterized protein n=1 Tax=Agaricus bisporus virus 16 TaxID=1945746 RepID=A0A1Q1M968_9VIRU|nr:hypothetical protein [Agaricus bisporus virus 16]